MSITHKLMRVSKRRFQVVLIMVDEQAILCEAAATSHTAAERGYRLAHVEKQKQSSLGEMLRKREPHEMSNDDLLNEYGTGGFTKCGKHDARTTVVEIVAEFEIVSKCEHKFKFVAIF